jgi:hypothetical protein
MKIFRYQKQAAPPDSLWNNSLHGCIKANASHLFVIAAFVLLLVGSSCPAGARSMMRAQAKPIESEAKPEQLFYHPAVGTAFQCDVSFDLTVKMPEDPSARLDFNTLTQNIAWTLKVVGAGADRTIQKQTLTDYSFKKDGKEFNDFDSGTAGILKLLKGRTITVDLSPSMKILDARIEDSRLNRDSTYLRQFLSFYYAADLFPEKGIPLTSGSTWKTDALFPLPGISDDYHIPLNAKLTEIRKVGDVDCALVNVEAHDTAIGSSASNKSIRNMQVTYSGEFCFGLADGVPVYGETELNIHADLEQQSAARPIDVRMRSRQTARPSKPDVGTAAPKK